MFGVRRIGALWAIALTIQSCDGQIDSSVCPAEISACLGDQECAQCLGFLQQGLDLDSISSGLPCEEVYAGLCDIVVAQCNPDNQALIDFSQCVTEDAFGCTDFTTCAEVTSASIAPAATTAPAPEPASTTAPASEPATVVPSAAPSAAPSEGSGDGEEIDPSASGGISRVATGDIMLPTFGLALASTAFAVLLGQ